jgi:hypothetical protein
MFHGDAPMANLVSGPLLRRLGRLSHPKLFAVFAVLFVLDLVLPDPLPFIDEILLGLATLLFGAWKERRRP